METIKLKDKKPWWKKFLLIITIIGIIILFIYLNIIFCFGYKYTMIDFNKNNHIIGYSQNSELIDDTVNNYIHSLNEQEIRISDYNLKKGFVKHFTIVLKNKINDKKIINAIEKNTIVFIYAIKITKDNENIYIPYKFNYEDIIKQIKEKNQNIQIEFVYVDKDKISTKEEIKEYIDNL